MELQSLVERTATWVRCRSPTFRRLLSPSSESDLLIKSREAPLRSKTNLSFASRPVFSDILTLYFANRPVVSDILTLYFVRLPIVSDILTLYFASKPVGSDAPGNMAASLLSIFGPFLYYCLPPWTYHVAKPYNDVHVISTWFLWAVCLPNTNLTAFAENTVSLHARNINVHIDNILSYLCTVVILLQDNNLVSPTRYYGHVSRLHSFSLRSRCIMIRHPIHYVRSVCYYMKLAVPVPIFRM